MASFAAMVSRLDKYVGDVMAELKELGLDKNTIVIFTSDNGPHHEVELIPIFSRVTDLLGGSNGMYMKEASVYLWWHGAGYDQGRSPIGSYKRILDVMPTLAELTGTVLPEKTDGISFLPTCYQRKINRPMIIYIGNFTS